ncbi:hypothetical protein BDD12DRAFT_911963 [Trichophaea hybrida]|nr:hypothetical protein BDD12DRAFT_911963 [Trichophaea hybrida]
MNIAPPPEPLTLLPSFLLHTTQSSTIIYTFSPSSHTEGGMLPEAARIQIKNGFESSVDSLRNNIYDEKVGGKFDAAADKEKLAEAIDECSVAGWMAI